MAGNQPVSDSSFAPLAAGYALSRPAVHPLVIERMYQHLRPARPIPRALDVGCGSGLSTKHLGRLAAQTFGIDVAQPMLAWASRIAPDAHFAAARAEALPIRAASIGMITAAGSLNYTRLDVFFLEASRVLAPGGVLVVYDFSPGRALRDSASLDEWFSAFLSRYPWPPDEAVELSPQKLSQLTRLFHVRSHEDFEIPLPLTAASYLDYMLTETNVAHALKNGEPLEEIRAWCEDGLARVFEGRGRPSAKQVLFRGYIAYLYAA